jgi:hypothetical protein
LWRPEGKIVVDPGFVKWWIRWPQAHVPSPKTSALYVG